MERRLTELWYREDAGPTALQPLAWLYGAVLAARRRAYDSGRARPEDPGVPVVVVGNLTVGGTGKTPLTIWLARELGARGLRVGIVSRGYGARAGTAPRLVSADSDWRIVGDEPLLIARRSGCETLVAADRTAAARALAARGVQVVIADDGLQHLRLARVCEVLVVDGARGFGNQRLLPAGPLREPLTRPLHADAVVVNGTAEHASLGRWLTPGEALTMRLVADQVVPLAAGEAPQPLAAWRGRRVHAVAGIGNPARFFRDLRAHGLEVEEHAFPDHHALRAAELEFGDQLPVLMTEKDAVKCSCFAAARLWCVPVTAQFSDADAAKLLTRVTERITSAALARGRQ
jgi:tetraacyldisaccharide 4'-kinase